MIAIHCSTLEQLDACWRMLTHLPDADLQPVDIYLSGYVRYRIIRRDGEQTSVQPADPPGCSSPTL